MSKKWSWQAKCESCWLLVQRTSYNSSFSSSPEFINVWSFWRCRSEHYFEQFHKDSWKTINLQWNPISWSLIFLKALIILTKICLPSIAKNRNFTSHFSYFYPVSRNFLFMICTGLQKKYFLPTTIPFSIIQVQVS